MDNSQTPSTSAYDFAIIIPAWNEQAFLADTLEAVLRAMASVEANGQLIVVDNNSTDNTAHIAREYGALVVFEPINQISRARNAGARASTASYLVFVDADSELTSELLNRAITLLQSEQTVGGGALVAADREVNWSIRTTIASWNLASRWFKLAAGCFVFARADAFAAVGGFSEKRFAGEELSLSRELKRWGRKHSLRFHIISDLTMTTSMRKADWYSAGELMKQFFFAMIPGALNSKRFMNTWYDSDTERSKHDD